MPHVKELRGANSTFRRFGHANVYDAVPVQLIEVVVDTDALGNGTMVTPEEQSGQLHQLRYVPDPVSPFLPGADLVISGTLTGMVPINYADIGATSWTVLPRRVIADRFGKEVKFYDRMAVNEPLALTISQGGPNRTGKFYVWVLRT